jgi:flagellar protein FlgJ
MMDISKITAGSTGGFTSDAARAAAQSSDDSFAKRLEAAVNGKDDKELKKACQDFEGVLLGMMYKAMKATIIKSDLVEHDAGMEIFESMQDDALMEQVSKTGSLGLAESLYKQLAKKTGAGANTVKTEETDHARTEESDSTKTEEIQGTGPAPENSGE